MRKITNYFVVGLLSASVIACQKDKAFEQEDGVSQEVLAKISELGFSTDDVKKLDNGYLVEGDIVLTPEMMNGQKNNKLLRIADVEQYHTTNLVKGLPRTINVVTTSDVPSTLVSALNAAVTRYNNEPLALKFTVNGSGTAHITIKMVNTTQYIASAGFPTSGGEPYNTINYSTNYVNYGSGFLTTVLAHEMGHCIGFRHTDYMNRAYSCGGRRYNEGTAGVGAIHIPGTPTGPDPNSWMLACLSSTTDRPFNANDKTALNYLY
jgi:hypothetical protein